jgi:hypothetical protein
MQFLPNQCPTSFCRFAGPQTRELRARYVIYACYSLKCSATSKATFSRESCSIREAPYIPTLKGRGLTARLDKVLRHSGGSGQRPVLDCVEARSIGYTK